ncbi:MAG: hypothetical protein RL090_828 [Bacteroidota bacterium]
MKKHAFSFLVVLLQLLAVNFSKAQVYTYIPDSTFDGDGRKNFNFFNNIDRLYGVVVQQDGKSVMAGLSRNPSSGFFELCITRLLINGDLDTTFNGTGTNCISMGVQGSIGGMTPKIKIAPDGKFVLVNSGFPASSAAEDIMVCRLDTNGVLDPTFNGAGVLFVDMTNTNNRPDRANDLDIASDGSIWAAGVTRTGGTPLDNEFAVVKVAPNGQLDLSFNGTGKKLFNPTGFAEFGRGIRIQSDGKIVLGGDAGGDMHVLRFDSTGLLDNTFNGTGSLNVVFQSFSDMAELGIDSLGRIVVAGNLTTSTGDVVTARILPNGTFDTNYGTNGKYTFGTTGTSNIITQVHVQPDMKILIGGYSTTVAGGQDFLAARVDTSGVIDLTFNVQGYVTQSVLNGAVNEECNGLALMGDGRILLTGTLVLNSAINEDVGVVRLLPVITSGTGLEELASDFPVRVGPNPFQDELSILSQIEGDAVLVDAMGKVVMKIAIRPGVHRFDASSLSSGMYLLHLPGRGSQKIIKK